jgi:hypothetical protein
MNSIIYNLIIILITCLIILIVWNKKKSNYIQENLTHESLKLQPITILSTTYLNSKQLYLLQKYINQVKEKPNIEISQIFKSIMDETEFKEFIQTNMTLFVNFYKEININQNNPVQIINNFQQDTNLLNGIYQILDIINIIYINLLNDSKYSQKIYDRWMVFN